MSDVKIYQGVLQASVLSPMLLILSTWTIWWLNINLSVHPIEYASDLKSLDDEIEESEKLKQSWDGSNFLPYTELK